MRNYAFFALLALFIAGCGEDHKDKSASEIAHDLCEIELTCQPGLHSSLRECETEVRQALNDTAQFSGACGRATRDFFGCYSTLSICGEHDDFWLEHPPSSYPCRDEQLAQERACAGFSDTVEEPPSPAEKYCELEMACGYDDYLSVRDCVADYEEWAAEARYISANCGHALTAYFACLGEIATCAELDNYWFAEEPPYPCWAEEVRLDEECEEF